MSVATAGSERVQTPWARVTAPGRSLLIHPWPWVGALTVLAAALRFYRLRHQGFWFDEANTALLVHFSPGKMLGLLPKTESTPPLYYCVAWVWARVFGYGEAGLRSLSAVAGVLTVPVAYGAARRLVSVRAGILAAALTTCSPLLIWYSQEARSYALFVLASSASLLAFAYLLERPGIKWGALWVLASAIALATHYYAMLIVLPEAAWLLVAHRRVRAVTGAVSCVALCGLALIPLALSQKGSGHTSWIASAPLGRRLREVVPQFLIGFGAPAYTALEVVAIVLAGLAVALIVLRSGASERRAARLAGVLVAAGLVLNLLLIAAGIDDLLTRNLLALWMPAMVGLAAGFAAPRARLAGASAASLLCAIGLFAALATATDRSLQRPDWRGVAALLGARPASGAGGRAILIQHYRDLLPLSLYLPGLRSMRFMRSGARVGALDVVSFTSPPSTGFCWWGSACNLSPTQMQASYRVPGFHVVWRRRFHQFTVLHMVAAKGRAPVSVRLVSPALRTTRFRNDELLIQR